ncbi:MAG TPA: xanthine dehydrogenase family protein subunit M [Planctomycetes bacterium]|nr:xanthine dehydrogenase family protein subunit M [Planctomycetota bacterium]
MHRFRLEFPKDVAAATSLLPSHRGPLTPRDARVLAGGQDLLGELKDHLVEPDTLVSLHRIPGLDGFELGEDLRLGALVTLAVIERDTALRERFTVLAEAAESVATPQIRTQATLGGNLCQRPRCWYYRNEEAPCIKKGGAECFAFGGRNKYNAILGGGPSYIVHPSDLAPALVCLDATVTKTAREGTETIALESFFTLPSEGSVQRENVLRANELLLGVHVPALGPGWKSTYLKFRERESFDFALAAVALAVRLDGERIAEAKLVLGGVAPIPWRARAAEDFVAGKPNTRSTWKAAADLALAGAEPLEHNAYKIPLTKGLIQKAFRKLA